MRAIQEIPTLTNQDDMKYPIFSVLLILMGISTCMAQSEIMVDSHYFTRSNGLDVYVNNTRIGTTPLTFSLAAGRKSVVEFRNQQGNRVSQFNVQPEQVSNIRSLSATPAWFGSASQHPGYPGYQLTTSEAESRSLSISLNKAKTEAIDHLSRTRSGNRTAAAGRSQHLSQSLQGAQILECHIYFDGNGYRTYLLVGLQD